MKHPGLKLRMVLAGTILFAFYLAVAGAALAIWGTGVWPFVAVGTVVFVGFQYIVGKKMALWSVGAEDMPEDEYPQIHQSVEQLSRQMGVEKPRLMIADMGVPNAFAVGRKGAGVVVVSRELIQLLEFDELEGVLAHELSHIDNRDVVLMVLGQSIAAIVGIAVQWAIILGERNFAAWIAGWILGTIAQMIVMIFVLAISRYREYVADRDAADAIGRGEPLARALEKISSVGERSDAQVNDSVNALCIFGGERGLLARIFATHPPTEKRIQRLRGY